MQSFSAYDGDSVQSIESALSLMGLSRKNRQHPIGTKISGRTNTLRDINVEFLSSSLLKASIGLQRLYQLITEQVNRLNAIMTAVDDGLLLMEKDGSIVIQNDLGRKYLKRICDCQTRQDNCIIHETVKRRLNHSHPTVTKTVDKKNDTYTIGFNLVPQKENEDKVSIRIHRSARGHRPPADDPAPHGQLIGELTSAIAHEINNPLTPILGLTTASLSGKTGSDLENHMKTIHRAGERIAKVIHRLLYFDNVKNWKTVSTLNMNGILDNVMEETKESLARCNIRIQKDDVRDLPLIQANGAQLQHLLISLVQSIREQMLNSGSGSYVTLSTENRKGKITVVLSYDQEGSVYSRTREEEKRKRETLEDCKDINFIYAEILAQMNRVEIEHDTRSESEKRIFVHLPRSAA